MDFIVSSRIQYSGKPLQRYFSYMDWNDIYLFTECATLIILSFVKYIIFFFIYYICILLCIRIFYIALSKLFQWIHTISTSLCNKSSHPFILYIRSTDKILLVNASWHKRTLAHKIPQSSWISSFLNFTCWNKIIHTVLILFRRNANKTN